MRPDLKRLTQKQKRRQIRRARRSFTRRRSRKQSRLLINPLREKYAATISQFSTQSDQILLVSPSGLNLDGQRADLVRLIYNARVAAMCTSRRVLLDFRSLQDITPPAIICLAAEIFRLRQRFAGRISGTYPDDPQISAILNELGFFKLLGVKAPHRFVEPDEDATIVQLQTATGNVGQSIAAVQDAVFEYIALDTQNAENLYGALDEAMTNVSEHAYPEPPFDYDDFAGPYQPLRKRWWMLGFADKADNDLWFLLYDQGVSIPVTVPQTVWERLRMPFDAFLREMGFETAGDSAYIQLSTKIGRSQTMESHRGKGIARMMSVVRQFPESELQILSRYGEYRYTNTAGACAEQLRDHSEGISGTLISWRLHLG